MEQVISLSDIDFVFFNVFFNVFLQGFCFSGLQHHFEIPMQLNTTQKPDEAIHQIIVSALYA